MENTTSEVLYFQATVCVKLLSKLELSKAGMSTCFINIFAIHPPFTKTPENPGASLPLTHIVEVGRLSFLDICRGHEMG